MILCDVWQDHRLLHNLLIESRIEIEIESKGKSPEESYMYKTIISGNLS